MAHETRNPPQGSTEAGSSSALNADQSRQDCSRTSAEQEQVNSDLEITVFDKIGGPLTKRIYLNEDGKVIPDGSACVMVEGEARRVVINDTKHLAAVIGGLRSYQAIALGTLREDLPDECKIVVKEKLNGDEDPNIIARTLDNIIYRENEPALALVDFDKKGMPDEMCEQIGDEFWDVLIGVMPALSDAAHVMRRSTSAGLYNGDEELPSSGGWHVYVVIEDGSDSERFLKTLHDRCWLAGFGWWWISEGATVLERSIIDRFVWSSERLVFEGPPIIEKPLRQDAECRKPIPYSGEIIDTRVVCPSLTPDEQKIVDKLKAEAKERMQPEIDKARAAYIEKKSEEYVKRTGVSKDEAVKAVEQLCDNLELPPHHVLEFADPKLKDCTVGDVLADPERFQNKSLADPIDGVDYGRSTAKVLLGYDDGVPFIKSFAHGGRIFFLNDGTEDREPVSAIGRWAKNRRGKLYYSDADPNDAGQQTDQKDQQAISSDETPRFKLIPFRELVPGKERNYLIKGLIPRVGLVVIWGPPKCFKSFSTMDMVMHVALGCADYRGRRVQQGAVVYCAFEGAAGFGARAAGMRQAFELPPGQEVPFFLSPMRMNLVKDHKALIKSIQLQVADPVIVVLDTLNRSLEGSESSDEDMGAYLNAADAIRETFNCMVIIVHHCGIDGTRPRGHTSLSGTVDAQLSVQRDGDTNSATITVEWMKDGPEGDVIESEFERVTVGTDEDGDEISTLIVKPSKLVITPKHKQLDGQAQTALRLLREAIANEGEVKEGKNLPRNIPVVPIEKWRSYCYAGNLTRGETQIAKRKAFSRVMEKLQNHHRLIQTFDEFVWVVA